MRNRFEIFPFVEINSKIHTPAVKLPEIEYLTKQLEKDNYMMSIDLQDCYCHLMLHPSMRRIFAFAYPDEHGNIIYYQYLVMPL